MINLLVAYSPEKWETSPAYFERDRSLTEYISAEFKSRFSALGEEEIEQIKSFPAIFVYEKEHRKDAYVGNITNISVRQNNIKLDYQLSGEKISFEKLISMQDLLDLSSWELNRTHWTIKNINIEELQPYYSVKNECKPTVFISYSWTPIENQKRVFELVDDLTSDGISVKYDKNALSPGQDKNYFMEQALTNHEIDKVLVVCNHDYATKANRREGGVGHETEIIISQISSQPLQTKYIPVVMESDEKGKPFLPNYFASRIYIDLTKETGYGELLTAIRNRDGESSL